MTMQVSRLTGEMLKKLSPGACRLLLAYKEEPEASVARSMELTGYSRRWIKAGGRFACSANRSQRPARQCRRLLGAELALLSLHGMIRARIDGNVLASRLTQNTGKRGALARLARDCGDT